MAEMYLKDTLSRAHLPRPSDCRQEEFETVKALSFLVMPEEKIHEIRRYTREDTSLQQLKRIIQMSWPADQSSLPLLVTPYFSIRDELAVTDGLIFRGERLVIPKGMRAAVKKDIHSGYQGIEACLRHAREHVFWLGMNKELKAWIRTCETCRENEQTPCKETLMPHEILKEHGRKSEQTSSPIMTNNILLPSATNQTSGNWIDSSTPIHPV